MTITPAIANTGESVCDLACNINSANYFGAPMTVGYVTVPGKYEGEYCIPEAYGYTDLKNIPALAELCNNRVASCTDGGQIC